MGIDRLLCLTLNTNDLLKQFLGKILLNLMDFLKKFIHYVIISVLKT